MVLLKTAHRIITNYSYLLFVIATSILTFVVFSSAITAFADDECKKIGDLDDRAKCYADKIEEKEEDYESTSKKLEEVKTKKDSVSGKISELSGQLTITQGELNSVQEDINEISKLLEEIKLNLEDRHAKLSDKIDLRNRVVRNYAKKNILNDLEMLFGFARTDTTNLNNFQFASLSQAFNKSVTEEAINLIKILNSEIAGFEKDKKESEKLKAELETEQQNLIALKNDLDTKKNSAESEKSELENKESGYEEELEDIEKEIQELSAKQQAILQAKSGDFSASLSEGVETDDPRTSPSYNPGFSPAFAAFSYGAYTHRNGLSQYGARGRAEDGQDYKEILEFYYKTGVEEKSDLDDKSICVQGQGNMDMGKYLRGLGEMPPSWNMEALKAQAIAARTYAYRYTKNGNCICTTTNCQYFHKDLVNRSDRERWYEAIEETENKILKGDVSAQYSSTTGGWINGIGWDKDGNWPNDAYEKKGGSPWFFKSWFTQTYKKDSSTCGRSHPWLDDEEMADILNAYLLLKAGKNTERIVPETINKCPINGVSGNPYSKKDMRSKAESATGKSFSKVTGVSSHSYSDGRTTKFKFETDSGTYEVTDAQLFAEAFNLRAPGYIAIKHSPDSKALFEVRGK